jgi:hypothetical protein
VSVISTAAVFKLRLRPTIFFPDRDFTDTGALFGTAGSGSITCIKVINTGGMFPAIAAGASPPGGLTTTPSLLFGKVAAQIEVTPKAVNITGITVDAPTSSSSCPSGFYVGVASGTVNEAQTGNQDCNPLNFGVRILAEDGQGWSHSVTIKNSCVHDNGGNGIVVYGASLNISIENNDAENEFFGISQQAAAGNLSGNALIAKAQQLRRRS